MLYYYDVIAQYTTHNVNSELTQTASETTRIKHSNVGINIIWGKKKKSFVSLLIFCPFSSEWEQSGHLHNGL